MAINEEMDQVYRILTLTAVFAEENVSLSSLTLLISSDAGRRRRRIVFMPSMSSDSDNKLGCIYPSRKST